MMEHKISDNSHKRGTKSDLGGVIKIAQQGQLPQEFITIGANFEEALGRCSIRDEEQRNAIIIYKAQLGMFDMYKEIQDLTNFLNGSNAIGGYNKSLAAMAYTGIYLPEGAGIKMDKKTEKSLMELQQLRARAGKRDNEEHEQ